MRGGRFYKRAELMPLWEDCPFELPAGVIPHRDGNLATLVFGGNVVGLFIDSFDEKNLPEMLSRLGLRVQESHNTLGA